MITINDFNSEKYTTKEELMSLYGLSEREVRKQVEELRRSGLVIISTPAHKGYKLPSSWIEVESYLNDVDARIKSLSAISKSAKKLYKNKDQFALGFVK